MLAIQVIIKQLLRLLIPNITSGQISYFKITINICARIKICPEERNRDQNRICVCLVRPQE